MGGMAGKSNNNQIWRNNAIGAYVVEFIGLMKNNFVFVESYRTVIGHNIDLPFIYTQKFPKWVSFSVKLKIAHIFKIVNSIKLFN